MPSWRDTLLEAFVPRVSKLTLVADPDGLLTEEQLARDLRDRGFDLIEYTDAVEFRYAYEAQYRATWDRGESTDLVVILRLPDAELESLPYDLLQAGRRLSFTLGELFPHLSYPVIEQLDRGLLDLIYAAQAQAAPERLGDNASRDFILRHVYGIAPELLATDVDLLRALLRLHYGHLRLPPTLAARLIQVLTAKPVFAAWPLEKIVPDAETFFAFLQERWPLFLAGLSQDGRVQDQHLGQAAWQDLQYPGPECLPFAHQDIRVYIDNLFVEGKLAPVQVAVDLSAKDAWLRSGIRLADGEDESTRIARLFDLIDQDPPSDPWSPGAWLAFAPKWAQLTALVHHQPPGPLATDSRSRLSMVGEMINARFGDWLVRHFASLINLPPVSPVMVHQIARRLARDLEAGTRQRLALIVMDGLALDQWVSIRQHLQGGDGGSRRPWIIREAAAFAWIPTLTSVSRQAIFAGRPPLYFPSSINSTNSEEKLWKQFWEGHGLSRLDVAYLRGLGDGDAAGVLDAAIHPGKTQVVGLVIDKVDKIMHGMQLGAAGMHNQIRQWCQEGFLENLIEHLLERGFEVWLTSDHGNIPCEGRGRPAEGVIAEVRGERVRVYPTPELRAQVAEAFPFAHEWQPVGLPADYFPLVAGGRDAFVIPGEAIVGHGGVAIEEVIVPLVKFERRTG